MISYKKFTKLTTKQKLYKIANAVRECEAGVGKPDDTGIQKVMKYIDFLKTDLNDELSLTAYTIMNKYLSGELSRKNLNFCFHEIVNLLGIGINENDFLRKNFDNNGKRTFFDTIVILDNLRSPFNVGSIFRSSECLGVRELALCGITPTPESLKVQKTSMNTCGQLKWNYFPETSDAISEYKNSGYTVFAVETLEKSLPVFDVNLGDKNVFVFGNEEFGMTEDALILCDMFVSIPLTGNKNSLNVASAFSIIAYEVMRKNRVK